jgi:hypothetical protein
MDVQLLSPDPEILPPPAPPEKLSALLRRVAEEFAERPLDFQELVRLTHGRAYDVLLVFLSLPFLTPIPLPFLSTVLGSVMVLIGARLALGQRPWLPQYFLRRKVEGRKLITLLNAGSRIFRWLEIFLRPRLSFIHTTWIFQRLTGAFIVVSGVFLLLPLPIPLTNILPASTVLVLAAGALERDGVFFLTGCVLFTLNLVFFGALAFGAAETVTWIVRWMGLSEVA